MLEQIFNANQSLVLFLYGQTFFMVGVVIFLQSRRHSRLRLSRDLRWMAAFGILYGLHEWGYLFIPMQQSYLSSTYINLLETVQIIFLASAFACLLIFGAATLDDVWPWGKRFVVGVSLLWIAMFVVTYPLSDSYRYWHDLALIWARYLLGLPGALLAAYGLRYQAKMHVEPLGTISIYRMLQIAGGTLLIFAILGGILVPEGDFFPANFLNQSTIEKLLGIPVEVLISIDGLILVISMMRALEIFQIEIDRRIEELEVERIQATERERISQEVHDVAIQAVFSASLMLGTLANDVKDNPTATERLDQSTRMLSGVIDNLKRSMIEMRANNDGEPIMSGLRRLASDPRFSNLLHIHVKSDIEPNLKPTQVGHALAIVQESLSNTIRHAHADQVTISMSKAPTGVSLRIEDNGQGFDIQRTAPGFGLRAIRDRARLIGGNLNIQSNPGKGTAITLIIPGV